MKDESPTSAGDHSKSSPQGDLESLAHLIHEATHYLPAQGPITVFVHHNTLHSLEEHSFEKAVAHGAEIFGNHPYLPETSYWEMLARGRIRESDIDEVLRNDLGPAGEDLVAGLSPRRAIRMAMLATPLREALPSELRWYVADTEALTHFVPESTSIVKERSIEATRRWVMRDLRRGPVKLSSGPSDPRAEALLEWLFQLFPQSSIERWDETTWEKFTLHLLWQVCHQGAHGVEIPSASFHSYRRHRDLLLQATGQDSDQLVNDVLIRFCAAFLDQGFAPWPMADRRKGFIGCFQDLFPSTVKPLERWLKPLGKELDRLGHGKLSPLESIRESLYVLGVPVQTWGDFVRQSLLSLRGWGGMIWQMEVRGDRVAHPVQKGSLIEFLAVRLLLDRLAVAWLSKETLGYTGPLSELRRSLRSLSPHSDMIGLEQRGFTLFQLAQLLPGWTPPALYKMSKGAWSDLISEIERFSGLERRRIYQLSFERRYRVWALDALSNHGHHKQARPLCPAFQLITCIDDREESLRRHVEELLPEVETFGAAGFFSVPMYYRGSAEANFVPLCPIVILPQHWVQEVGAASAEGENRRRERTRKLLGTATQSVHLGSRSFTGGALLAAVFGPLASIPLTVRILFPRFTSQVRKFASQFVRPIPDTELTLERRREPPGPEEQHLGFTVDEMASFVDRLLVDIGLTNNFARVVVIMGHGSSSLNNPHEAAYHCGACGGNRGGPNARAFARMANDPRVRHQLDSKGVHIPEQTVFVGAYHNTCDDSIVFEDLDTLPDSHKADFERVQETLEQAREMNAHERARRFELAPLDLTPTAALHHVEARAEDLAQTRPEYNHATNAMCVVGRRTRTRGLFLDRRSFLVSYDPTQEDADSSILNRILSAVGPVCAGINLEYYFSCVDSAGWGCGTKLPHNVTSLLGVMDGAGSDLRPGLSQQMTEIHEPVRILFVIETTPERFSRILDNNATLARLFNNEWILAATLHPDSRDIHFYRDGKYEPYTPESTELPEVESSIDWYRGWRGHLGFASIRRGLPRNSTLAVPSSGART
ncbi:DUF2309 domain-containing protein [bacterium]|nr:DUF2309 domain-containing protein [bacterium]